MGRSMPCVHSKLQKYLHSKIYAIVRIGSEMVHNIETTNMKMDLEAREIYSIKNKIEKKLRQKDYCLASVRWLGEGCILLRYLLIPPPPPPPLQRAIVLVPTQNNTARFTLLQKRRQFRVMRFFYLFFIKKNSIWAPYKQAKTVMRTFQFSRRYLRNSHIRVVSIVNDYVDTV